VFSKLENYQCLIGIIYNEKEILTPVTQMMSLLIAILIFAALAVICYIIISYRKIYSPANVLVNAMKRVAEGDFQSHANIINNSEFGMMSAQFNNMVDQLDRSVKEKYLAQVNLNKAQLKFLKSQIKPHFLYNCLFSLYNMIKSGDVDNAANMTMYLGRFYQMSSHFDDKDTTVIREIENIKLYLKIHQLRSPDKFEYNCQIDMGLENMIIPTLSLHTIVENAISHAFELYDRKNIIEIKAIYKDKNIELVVADNGVGLSEDQSESILSQVNNPDLSDTTHGIQNVFSRFKLMYGQEVEFKICTDIGLGTKFTIVIPTAIKKDDYEEVKNV
jgi:two-component system sensor histidine kinase YesM